MLCLTVLTSVGIEFYCSDVAYAASKKKKSTKNKSVASQQQSKPKGPRNLLDEYFDALKKADSQKAISILNEGLTVSDANELTFRVLKAKVENMDLSDLSSPTEVKAAQSMADVGVGIIEATLGNALTSVAGRNRFWPVAKLSDTYVGSYSKILHALKQKGAKLSSASAYDIFFDQRTPLNLFKVFLEVTDKKVFTGKEISNFLLCYDKKETLPISTSIGKLRALKDFGVKIDRSSSSDGIVAKVLESILPSGWVNNNYLEEQEVSFLKTICGLLVDLGVNAGPKKRDFWQVMSTKTPWEILNNYKEEHRNEPEILQRCNEIEKILPPVGN